MVLVIGGTLISFLVTFFIMPFIIRIARINKLYDIPDERKTHASQISSLGGVGIVAGLAISLLLILDFTMGDSEFQFYLASVFIIFILGVIDDIFVLRAWKKVLFQIIVAAILTTKGHLLINNLYGLAGIGELGKAMSYFISFFVIILIINSFNLIDGIDGLAGSLGLVSSLTFGTFFLINNNMPYAIMGYALSGSLLAFLYFNFPPASIFMGDSGSMLIGLVNTILVIKFIQTGNQAVPYPVASPFVIGFGILAIPLLDVLRVFIIRLTKGVSPFAPDRNHLHHLLLVKGFSHKQVTLLMAAGSILFSGIVFNMQVFDTNFVIISLALLFFAFVFVIKYFLPSRKLHVVGQKEIATQAMPDGKVLNLFGKKETAVVKED